MYLEVQSEVWLALFGVGALPKESESQVCEPQARGEEALQTNRRQRPLARKRLQHASTLTMPSEPLRSELLLFTRSVAFCITAWLMNTGPATKAWVVLYKSSLSGSPTVSRHVNEDGW